MKVTSKGVTITATVLCVIAIGTASILYQKVREQAVIIDCDVRVRVAEAELHRSAMQFLVDDNQPMSFTNLAYLLYMDTCLADVAEGMSLSQRQKKDLTDEARLARQLFDHPALTNFAAFMNSNDILDRVLWPKQVADRNQKNTQPPAGGGGKPALQPYR